MKSNRREFLKGLGAFGGIGLLGGFQNVFASSKDVFEMLVVGDSLIAGQGLNDKDKFSLLTADWLENEYFNGERKVNVTNLSHSGARLFLQPDEIKALNEAEKDFEEFYHPEVNFSFPSSKSQVDVALKQYREAGTKPDKVRLVLMSGGITDLNASFVVNGFLKYRPLREKIEEHCNESMFQFLKYASGVFPNALFTVVGYFPIASNKSDTHQIYNAILELYEFPGPTKPILNNIVTKQFFKILHGRLTKRSRIWYKGSNSALQTAIRRVNEHTGKTTAVFVESPIPEERSFATNDSLLFGMGKKGRSEDFMYDVRQTECPKAIEEVKAIKLKFKQRFCELSALGHPNPEGSRLYAEAIQARLKIELDL